MFNKDLVTVLGQLSAITDSCILKYPVTYATTAERDIMVKIPVSTLDPSEFTDIGFNHSLSDFLKYINLMPEKTNFSVANDVVLAVAESSGGSFLTDDKSLLETFDIDGTQFERTEAVPTICQFELSKDEIAKLRNASDVFKMLNDVVFEHNTENKLSIKLASLSMLNARSHSYSINKVVNAEKDFSLSIPVDNLKKIPLTDYDVLVKYNENAKKSKLRIMLKCKSLENFDIIMYVNC